VIAYVFKPPVEALGWRMETLEDAAYVVRKYAIDAGDAEARRLVRAMRDAQTIKDAAAAEIRLRAWAQMVTAPPGPPISATGGNVSTLASCGDPRRRDAGFDR